MSQALTRSAAFVLRRNPFRDNSLLLDLFTEEEGRLSAVVRYSKRQSARIKGMFEPFRLLDCSWNGRGEVVTLRQTEERQRYPLKQAALLQATYLNELLLKGLLVHQTHPELFLHYQQSLADLTQQSSARVLLAFELRLLDVFGLYLPDIVSGVAVDAALNYTLHPGQGLQVSTLQGQDQGIKIPADLLLALQNPETLRDHHWQALRLVVDQLWGRLLPGKTLYARRLLIDL